MPYAVRVLLAALLILGGSVWTGGLVTVVVVSLVTRRTLAPPDRVAFFRALGRSFGVVSEVALLLALVSGGLLLHQRPWTATVSATVAIAACLLATTVIGVLQARRMTRLRQAVLRAPVQDASASGLSGGARLARVLRLLIALLTLALVGLTAALVV
ncbi:MAG: hypothetical protein ACREN1_07405 [Candidatus Dormibacteria bacterium]